MILMLVCMWAIGTEAVTTPEGSVPQDLTTGKVETPEIKANLDAQHRRKNAIMQERLTEQEQVSEAEKPVTLTPSTPSLLGLDGTVIDGREKKPFEGKANVPNPGLILQGGDDIGSATEIASLPYTDAGTTEGYTDDYDEQCPDPSTSPDVVYYYIPAGDETVDIYTWGEIDDFDTKVYLYENSYTPGNPFACNDDFFYGGESALQDLALTGGNTYYIVVDGWGGAFGDYILHMLVSPPRPPNNYCSDTPDTTLINGYTFTFTGTEAYALDTDEWFSGPEVFLPFTIPFTMDVFFNECGSPDVRTTWLNVGENCPLDGSTTSADTIGYRGYRDACLPDDDNISMVWQNLPPGTYNYPMFGQFPDIQPYIVHLTGHGCENDGIKVEIVTDEYPEDTSWEIRDHVTGVLVDSVGGYDDYPNYLFIQHVCVDPDGCYDFTIFDTFGDGICCAYGDGYYNVYLNGELVGEGGEFGFSETITNIGSGCTGACCVEGECVATNRMAECNGLGGDWYVDEDCFGMPPFECPAPVYGACCYDGQCVDNLQSQCEALGGYWHPDDECASYTCLDVVYHEDFDEGMGDWFSEESWEITFSESHTPPACMTDSPDGNYGNLENNVVELITDISLTGFVGYALEFDTKFQIETGFDYVYLDISADGGATWDDLAVFNGEAPEFYEWHLFSADISGYFDQDVRFRFTLESDGAYVVDGMYVDDFYVYGLTTDNTPPLIIHIGPTPETSVPGDHTAVATILDPSGIASATLTYTVDDGAPTTIEPDEIVDDEYTFIIPQQEAGAHVVYFITAEDNSANSGSTPDFHYVSGTIIMYDDNDPEFIYQYAAGDKVATRFTPPRQATLVTGMFRLYTDINRPLDYVDVEVWSNDGNDLPDQSLAGPIEVWPESDLDHPQAWTYVDFRGLDLTFAADEDFHTGYTYRSEWPVILGDSPAATDRSKTSIGGGPWGNAATDFHARVVLDLQEAPPCEYWVGDCNHNTIPMELGDVIAMIGMYRGTLEPPYTCPCPPHGDNFTPDADPNSNCTANELSDVVTMIGLYRGTIEPGNGCSDCPGQGRLLAPGQDGPLVVPSLKSKIKINQESSAD